ncbi:MAG: DUF5362 family protein [Flavipsychrobacter sp.]|nr:DUF5362 family protein [Flavipsychrobacter sp.]
MDYFYSNKETETGIFKMEVDATAQSHFLEMARWTKFLAIMGFVFMGLLMIVCIAVGVFLANSSTPVAGINNTMFATIYLVVAAIYIYPIFALYKYSTQIKKAIITTNQELFNSAISYLKRMFKYTGILLVIFIAIYGVAFLVMLASNAANIKQSLQ